ncbi:hypothetical protein GTZ99_02625 [Novosphingobium sp. FSY-8]|uniref:Gfo/Idh/MocA-like oxidoreductase N-terminal domain-containing protein n=1 Tax=Novosphingobium ovatum TaxID=1908523 RepID=A0ABW9XA85_9SPHN|nr:hypothetical protein [Novosphingobium ovatum]NBC35448.1 hypothetical protein [Novosphingobium ovatum]
MTSDATPKHIAILSADGVWGRACVASFPRSLRLAEQVTPGLDLVIVEGGQDWTAPTAHAIQSGTGHILVVDPGLVPMAAIETLIALADAQGAHVQLVSALADTAAVAQLRGLLTQDHGEIVIHATPDRNDSALVAVLLRQLWLARALGLDVSGMATIGRTAASFIIEGKAARGGAEHVLRLTGAASSRHCAMHLTAFAPEATLRLAWQGGADARPVDLSVADSQGLRQLPAIHHGGFRQALLAALDGAEAPSASLDLATLAQDLACAHTLLGTG